jgi:hypothetical protein
MYFPLLHIEVQFLLLCQAFESYHRQMGEGLYVGKQDYSRIVALIAAAIPSDTPADLRQRLERTLIYGNEYSLRKRLKVALGTLSPPVKSAVVHGPTDFVSTVVDTRNYLTHWSNESKPGAAHGGFLPHLVRLMRLLVFSLLVKELGLDPTVVQPLSFATETK